VRHSFKGNDGIWGLRGGEFRSQEDVLLEREHDGPAAIAREAAQPGISVESYLHVRADQELLHRLRRMVKAGNERIAVTGTLVLPITRAPADSRRSTTIAVRGLFTSLSEGKPHLLGEP